MSRILGLTGCCLKISCFDFSSLSVFICVHLRSVIFDTAYLIAMRYKS